MTRIISAFLITLFVMSACSSSSGDPITQKQDTSQVEDGQGTDDTTTGPEVLDATTPDPDGTTPDTASDLPAEEDICVPDCSGKECGEDGCGGECGACEDGIDCTQPMCIDGTCEFVLKADFCFIDETCVQSGNQHPDDACQWCAPGVADDAWSPAPDGDPCDEGWVCYEGACCNKAANCEGKACGDDGCGGGCDPGCKDYFTCLDGACSPTYAWGFSAIGTANEVCRDVAFDADGNVYVIASFDSLDVKIGTQKMKKDTTYEDLFLAKFTPDGQLDWWQSFATGEVVQFPKEMRLATDGLGRVAVAGGIMAWETGGFEFGQGLVQTGGDNNGFVGVFDNTGALVWSYYIEAENGDSVSRDVAMDATGNLYLGGRHTGVILSIGSDQLINNVSNKANGFIAKFDPDGVPVWARKIAGSKFDDVRAITLGSDDSIFVTGNFDSDSVSVSNHTVNNETATGFDGYVLKLDSYGLPEWMIGVGGELNEVPTAIAAAPDGGAYVLGFFTSANASIGTAFVNNAFSEGETGRAAFLARLTSTGSVAWVQAFPMSTTDDLPEAASTPDGLLYVTGQVLNGFIDFGAGPVGADSGQSLVIGAFDKEGSHRWSTAFLSPEAVVAHSIAIGPSGRVAVGGRFKGSGFKLGGVPLPSKFEDDLFVVTFDE